MIFILINIDFVSFLTDTLLVQIELLSNDQRSGSNQALVLGKGSITKMSSTRE